MSFEEGCLKYIPAMKYAKMMRYSKLERYDYDICEYVASNLPVIDVPTVFLRRPITQEELVESACESLEVFGARFSQQSKSILDGIKFINKNDKISTFTIFLSFPKKGPFIQKYGRACSILSYHTLYDNDVLTFGHECCHALKDRLYKEQKNYFITGEVIPLFYELLQSDGYSYDSIDLIRKRMWYLIVNAEEYMKSFSLFNTSDDEHVELYRYINSLIGGYLGSFYYAVILYHMYQSNPDLILEKVGQVLENKKTTIDILKELGIFRNIQGEIFEKEMHSLKKII